MTKIVRSALFTACVLALLAGSVGALVHDRSSESPLQAREFIAPALEATPINLRPSDASAFAELRSLGANPDVAFLDSRGGRWRTLLFAQPMIPGSGVGNDLTWAGGQPADDEALGDLAWERLREFIASHSDSLRIDVSELRHRVAVHNGGELIQIWADRFSSGIPVRGVGVGAVINRGNLVLMGAEQWGDIEFASPAAISAGDAAARVASFLAPVGFDSLRQDSAQVIVPARSASGDGYSHRLAWVVHPEITNDIGQWEALVDVHNGELLSFQDLNHYGTARTVTGGVYPIAYDDIAPGGDMVDNYPMPFADLSSGGFTDAGGNFGAVGDVTTTLTGEFINMQEFCGSISETSSGDLDLGGTDGDLDCTVPAGASAGNTAASRSGFYELNRIRAQASGQLTGNAWLNGQLTSQMNINQTCNAFWTGTVVQFFLETFPCANTGQVAGVFDHEWGHGMDDNDVVGTIPGFGQGGGEGMADIYAALRLNMGCIGRGFFLNGSTCGGYGDPCTAASGCTGVRSINFDDRGGFPHTLTWVRANCGSSHCEGAAYSETVWDLMKRDLPTLHGMDDNTALEVTTRLTYIGAGNATGWFDQAGGPPGAAGCAATQGYLQFVAADDDDGNIANGTPHMDAIASAFDRHEIGCTPANGGPTVTVSGCAGRPTAQPVVTAAATDMGADLSWDPIAGATTYNIYRTDGERECDFGKERVDTIPGTTFSDTGLLNDRSYYYVVTPMGAGGAGCFGPASACASVVPGGSIFANGFESGNCSAWSVCPP